MKTSHIPREIAIQPQGSRLVSSNSVTRLYHYNVRGERFISSSVSWDRMDEDARLTRTWLQAEQQLEPDFDMGEIGTEAHFNNCDFLLRAGHRYNQATGKRCFGKLIPELRGLEGKEVKANINGARVKFRVGMSHSWMPVHLCIRRHEKYGDPIDPTQLSNLRVL